MNENIFISENHTVEQALEHLEAATGIRGKWTYTDLKGNSEIDGKLNLKFPNRDKLVLYAYVKKVVSGYHLKEIKQLSINYPPLIVVAEEISPALKDQLRNLKIAYLDGAGNIYINTDKCFVWIDGNKQLKESKKPVNRAFTKAGLKVIFVLLTHPNPLEMTYRQIAAKANVALGNINLVFDGLKELGFLLDLNKKETILKNKKALLDRWINGYREILKPTLYLGSFRLNPTGENSWQQLPLAAEHDVWGGESAGEILTKYLNAQVLTIYTDRAKTTWMKDWKLIPQKDAKLQVYQKFWNDINVALLQIAPYLLVYTDLVLTDDPRCIETAEIIYKQYLKELDNE